MVGLLVVTLGIIGTLVYRSSSASTSPVRAAPALGADHVMPRSASARAPSSSEARRGDRGGAITGADGTVTEDDGALPEGVTVFDDEYPGVADLDPDLLRALRRAGVDAADDGIEIYMNSGWRSHDYQDQLYRAAVAKYGSAREAARWVATADASAHVSGDAADVGPVAATAWLSEHGAHYGLCQTYRNESWHYELRPQAIHDGCPSMYADSAHDPTIHR